MEHGARRLFGSAPILSDMRPNVGPFVVRFVTVGQCGPNASTSKKGEWAMSAGAQR
jgi:hypothetical protein